jgi:hypothetical protein
VVVLRSPDEQVEDLAALKAVLAMENEPFDISVILAVCSLPHLASLDWRSMGPLDQRIAGLAFSKVKHLLLHGSVKYSVPFPLDDGSSWPLVSLDLGIISDRLPNESGFLDKLFNSCSSTLECLTLRNELPESPDVEPLSFTADLSRLRFLQICEGTQLTDQTFQSLMRGRQLSVLISPPMNAASTEWVSGMGHIQSLKTLIWTGFGSAASLKFLEQNPQITAFRTTRTRSEFLERIIHVLRKFPDLKLLSMEVEEFSATSVLVPLGSLVSLEQLSLGAGCEPEQSPRFFVDHDAMMGCLCSLPKLKQLVIRDDAYGAEGNRHLNMGSTTLGLRLNLRASGRQRTANALSAMQRNTLSRSRSWNGCTWASFGFRLKGTTPGRECLSC